MKTLKIPQSFRHSAVEYFDRLVAAHRVKQFFVGPVAPDICRFPLAYELSDGEDDVPVAHLNPFTTDEELEIRVLGDIDPLEMLSDALVHIVNRGSSQEQCDAIEAIMEHCKITLSVADFGDDGHFRVESELEWGD